MSTQGSDLEDREMEELLELRGGPIGALDCCGSSLAQCCLPGDVPRPLTQALPVPS